MIFIHPGSFTLRAWTLIQVFCIFLKRIYDPVIGLWLTPTPMPKGGSGGKDFTIKICSDNEYEELVVDIYWKNYPFAMLSYDRDPESVEVEIYTPPEEQQSWEFTLLEITNVLEEAKKYLTD